MKSFASDNNSAVHPEILKAIADANHGNAVGYGQDPWTEKALSLFEKHFGTGIEVAFTFNGTGANIVALALANRSFNGVICSKAAHINVDECGAPENFTGCKLIDVDSNDGKLTVENIAHNLEGVGFEHHVQPAMVSITQSNELGLLYSCEEIKKICDFAHAQKLIVHVDGSRLSNAAAALGVSLRQASRDLGVDILSFGGTKNGMMYGEAVVVFNKDLFNAIKYVRKQAAQLSSKMRYISAQFIALLSDDLWLRNATNANRMANVLANRLQEIGIPLTRAVQVNAVFATLNPQQIEKLQREYFFYVWNENTGEVRWMTSFDTTESEIEDFISTIQRIL